MTKVIELETARLLMRQWCHADKEPFAQLNTDEKVMEFFPSCLSRAESDAMAEKLQMLIEQRGWGLWAVEVKAHNQFIGFVGLHIPEADLPFNPCVEVGWRLGYEYWGHGYATEAARAALKFGFNSLDLQEIVSFTALKNVRSQAVMQRIGMHRVAQTFQHPSVPTDSELREHCIYRLSQKDWLLQTQGM